MNTSTLTAPALASINGIALHAQDEVITAQEMRQRAYSELLRQAAIAHGLLPSSDAFNASNTPTTPETDGVLSEAASTAIEALLDQQLVIPDPSEAACQRHHAAHQATYSTGERVHVRHILFAVTQGVDVVALRNRAETTLLDVRCHSSKDSAKGSGKSSSKNNDLSFAEAARTLSNCPSGAQGGELGWLTAADCAPEFAKEIFGHTEVGVLPRLVHSRFGLHVVEVCAREKGTPQAYETVRGAVAMELRQKAFATALRQYMALLAGDAVVVGVDLASAQTPLVQ